MGDRCYMEIEIHKSIAEDFLSAAEESLYTPDEVSERGDYMVYGFGEVNYALGIGRGCFGDLPKGFPLTGSHGSGGGYGEGLFATGGKDIAYCCAVDEVPVIKVSAMGGILIPDQSGISDVQLYYDLSVKGPNHD